METHVSYGVPYLDELTGGILLGDNVVWVVEPALRKVFVYRPDAPREELSGDETLTGGEVLPGLEIPLAEVF